MTIICTLSRPSLHYAVSTVFCVAIVIGASLSGWSQTQKPPASNESTNQTSKSTVVGCLSGSPGSFMLSDTNGRIYDVNGPASPLEKYVGEEVGLEGTITGQDSISGFVIDVSSVREIFKAPPPTLAPSFSHLSNWRIHKDSEFGVQFAIPRFPGATQSGSLHSNFAADQGTVEIHTLFIPADIYPNTNFVGGIFVIAANPLISNSESCRQFGKYNQRFLSSRNMGGIRYTQLEAGEGSLGTSYGDYYFHAFRNGMCYELAFQFGAYSTGSQDLGCRVPLMRKEGELKVIDALANQVSFFHPVTKKSPQREQ